MKFFKYLSISSLLLLPSPSRALTYHGADISSLIIVEGQGHSFSDNGQVMPFEKIMTAHGGNAARVRVWTAGDYNTAYALSMAKRIKAAKMTLIVDMHFSDTCESARWISLFLKKRD